MARFGPPLGRQQSRGARCCLRAGHQRGEMLRRRARRAGRVDRGEVGQLLAGGTRGTRPPGTGSRTESDSGTRSWHRVFAALRTRCASTGISRRRFEPTTSKRIELVDVGDGEPTETGSRRIGGLVAEIRLAQAMVDVVRAQRARRSCREIRPRPSRRCSPGWRVPRRGLQALAAVSSAACQSPSSTASRFANHG